MGWDEVDALCLELADRLRGESFDAILGIARGGLVPAALLAQELDMRDVLVAAVASYRGDERGDTLHFLEFPPDQAIVGRRILVVDDIWDTGRTAALTRQRVVDAGGEPTIAVLHYKPDQSLYPDQQPDYWLHETDRWIVYPWERDT
jgi:hypoxanthine phosphoribosyltransferase